MVKYLIFALLCLTIEKGYAQPNPQEAQAFFIAGTTAFLAGDAEDALEQFDKALELYPNHPPILAAIAEVHLENKNYTSALFYINAIGEPLVDWEYVRLKSEIEKGMGDSNAALKTIETFVAQAPQETLIFELADLYFRYNKADKGIALLQKWSTENPKEIKGLQRLAQYFSEKQDYQQKIVVQKQIAERNGLDAAILADLAESFLQAQQPDAWKSFLEEALRKNPENSLLKRKLQQLTATTTGLATLEAMSTDDLLQKARIYFAQIEHPQAYQILKNILSVINVRTNSVDELHLMNAVVAEREGQYLVASDLYAAISQSASATIETWVKAISLAVKGGQADKAVRIADDALFLFLGNMPISLEAAKASLALKTEASTQDAFQLLTETLAIAKSDNLQDKTLWAELYNTFGDTFLQMNNQEKAKEMWKKALEYKPERSDIQQKL